MGLGNELHRINSKRADSTTGKKIVSASGLQSETAETRTARELAGMGGYLAENHLNEETFKVIHDAERGIGLFGPFDSVDEMLESLLDEGDD